MKDGIDIIIPWVDGSDPEWLAEFEKTRAYVNEEPNADVNRYANTYAEKLVATGGGEANSTVRYRDWGTLPYLFRGIEKFAPWVRKVHLVTWGHVPEWLDLTNPRLNVVKHSEFIPAEYLPTFASPPISLNSYRIEGLSERFILFNDDTFLLREVPVERFFKKGLPCDMARLTLIAPSGISHAILNMTEILNRRHDRRQVMRRHFWKWYSLKYGVGNLLKTIMLSPWKLFPGVLNTHMPQPYLRSFFEKMWVEEFDILDATSRCTFRSPLGVNTWVVRYEQLATGNFSPTSLRDTKLDSLSESRIDDIESYIRGQKYAIACLNDSPFLEDFEGVREKLIAAFEAILPEKSSYER